MAPCKIWPFHVPASQRSPGSVIISSHSSSCFIVFLAEVHNVTVHFGSYQHAGWAAAPNKLKPPFHPRFESTAHWSNSSRPWRRSSNCSLTEPEHVSPNLSVKTILHIIPRAVNETANRSTRPGETSGELRVVWSASYVQTVRNMLTYQCLQVFKNDPEGIRAGRWARHAELSQALTCSEQPQKCWEKNKEKEK